MKVSIFCLYVSKGCDFWKLVESLKKYNFDGKDNTCLIGDLNFDGSETNNFTRYMSKLQYSQMINRATHLDGRILDHVYIKNTKKDWVDIKHHYVFYSDHDGIIVSLKNDSNQ